MRKLLCIALLFSAVVIQTYAQTAPVSGGGDIKSADGSISYSIGQTFYESIGSISQGIQDPFIITVIDDVGDYTAISLNIQVYPNPTTDYVLLDIGEYDNLNYSLYNDIGNIIEYKDISNEVTQISMMGLMPAIYFVKVARNNVLIKTFKIVKN